MIKAYWGTDKNVGDTLTPVILHYFTNHRTEYVDPHEEGKLLMCGSLAEMVQPNDILLGVGYNKYDPIPLPEDVRILALRGSLTLKMLYGPMGITVKEPTFGDPALLLPLMYQPSIEPSSDDGWVPHYADDQPQPKGSKRISIEQDWQSFVDEISSCKTIYTSSLHGLIIAEAYGIPAYWIYSDKVHNAWFKFQDYFAGSDRRPQAPNAPLDPIPDLANIQRRLVDALNEL